MFDARNCYAKLKENETKRINTEFIINEACEVNVYERTTID